MGVVDKGTLVEFRVQGDRRLGVVDRPDGKTRWFVVDERGQSHSLRLAKLPIQLTDRPTKLQKFPIF